MPSHDMTRTVTCDTNVLIFRFSLLGKDVPSRLEVKFRVAVKISL